MKSFTLLSLYLLLSLQSIKAQINFTPSLNYTLISNYDDDSILYHCNDTMLTVKNDTLVINKLYDPGSGCPYEYKLTQLANDSIYVRF